MRGQSPFKSLKLTSFCGRAKSRSFCWGEGSESGRERGGEGTGRS